MYLSFAARIQLSPHLTQYQIAIYSRVCVEVSWCSKVHSGRRFCIFARRLSSLFRFDAVVFVGQLTIADSHLLALCTSSFFALCIRSILCELGCANSLNFVEFLAWDFSLGMSECCESQNNYDFLLVRIACYSIYDPTKQAQFAKDLRVDFWKARVGGRG